MLITCVSVEGTSICDKLGTGATLWTTGARRRFALCRWQVHYFELLGHGIDSLHIENIYGKDPRFKPSANGRQKSLNKCETQNEIVFYFRLRHPETITVFGESEKQMSSQFCISKWAVLGKQNIAETIISDTFVDK